jgi:hypothetical protein
MPLPFNLPLRARVTTLGSSAVSFLLTKNTTMAYSVAVNKPCLGPAPEAAKTKPHHIKDNNGTTIKYQNPHPSYKAAFQPWQFPVKAIM